MKLEVDVIRVEQTWDLRTQEHRNYFVVSILGAEARVPCTEEQLIAAIHESTDDPRTGYDDDVPFGQPDERVPVEPPKTFVPREPSAPVEGGVAHLEAAPRRRLAPIERERPRGDDVGIAQG